MATVAAREAAKQRWEYKEIAQLGVSRLGDPDQRKPNTTDLGLNTLTLATGTIFHPPCHQP
jgi:hypothetical protein